MDGWNTSKYRLFRHSQYIKPKNSQEVEDVIEIAELFLTSTEKYIEFGFLGAIDICGRGYVIFNIVSDKIEIYGEKKEEIIDLSQIDEKDLLDLGKGLTVLKTIDTSYSHNLDMSWDEFYAKKLDRIRKTDQPAS